MFNPKNFSNEKIMKMDAPALVAAWQDVAAEIQESRQAGPEMAEMLLAPLSDPVMLLVGRAYEIGRKSLETGEKMGSFATVFKSATEEAIAFLTDQGTASMMKVAVSIEPLQKEILPKLE